MAVNAQDAALAEDALHAVVISAQNLFHVLQFKESQKRDDTSLREVKSAQEEYMKNFSYLQSLISKLSQSDIRRGSLIESTSFVQSGDVTSLAQRRDELRTELQKKNATLRELIEQLHDLRSTLAYLLEPTTLLTAAEINALNKS